tara:strand:- start:480 stop:1076 length:597 start_codon:yes stop_codon:yes gene_type:complete
MRKKRKAKVYAFIGLGNFGEDYSQTKHNFGFWIVNEFVSRKKISFKPGKGDFIFAESSNNQEFLVVKPTSGMNRSGFPIKEVQKQWNLSFSDIHIIVDDVDLGLGTIRIRPRGGDGCHRGLESIIYHLGSTEFPRVRIGIATDEPMRPAENYVLKPFHKHYKSLVEKMINVGTNSLEEILANGLDQAMNKYNYKESIN